MDEADNAPGSRVARGRDFERPPICAQAGQANGWSIDGGGTLNHFGPSAVM